MNILHFFTKRESLPLATLLTLMFTIIMDVMGVGMVLPLLPSLVVSTNSPFHGEHSLLLYGVILSLWSCGCFFGSPFLGTFSDKVGRKKILTISLTGNTLVYAITALAIFQKWFWLFMIMRFCSGFFSGSFEIAQAAVADKSSKEEKARNMSLIIFAFAIGSIFGPLLSTITLSLGLIIPFFIASILSCINVFFLIIFFHETHVRKEHHHNWLTLLTSFTFVFRDSRVRNLGIVFLLFQFAWGFYFQEIPLIMQQIYHFVPVQISKFFMLIGVGFAIVPLCLQKFMSRYFSLPKIAFLGLILSALCISFAIILQAFVEVQWVVVLGFAIFESLAFGSLLALLSNQVSNEEQGKIMGCSGSLYAISFIVIGLSVGILSNVSVWLPLILSVIFFFTSGLTLRFMSK